MASDGDEKKIIDTEQLEWLSKSFHGLIIGKKGSGLKELKEQVGVQASFLDDKCLISGSEEQLNQAKLLISQKVKKQEMWNANKRGIHTQSCVPPVLTMKNQPWEEININPKYYRYFSDENLQTKYGVILRLRKSSEKGSQIVIQGSDDGKIKLKKWFEEFDLKQKERAVERKKELEEMVSGKDCEAIEVESKYIPRIIGKAGIVKTNIEKKHDVIIHIDSTNSKIYIKGEEEARNQAKVAVEYLMFDNEKKQVSGGGLKGSSKGTLFVGLNDNDDVFLSAVNCPQKKHCQIISFPENVNFGKNFENICGLKELVTRSLERIRESCDENEAVLGDVMIHCGKFHYKYNPGSYKVSTLRSNQKFLEYERFLSSEMNFDKLAKLPVVAKYVRFDFKIFATSPSTEIRYKVFVDDSGPSLSFMDITETDVSTEEMLTVRAGPGYFCHPEHRISRLDVVDASSNITTRINISIIKSNKGFSQAVESHIPLLRDFLENITVQKVDGRVKLILPKIGEKYKITFVRGSERKCYKSDDGCILKTSKEEITLHESDNTGGSSTDVFYKNEELSELLESRCWTVSQVEDMLERLLSFSDKMGQYLL